MADKDYTMSYSGFKPYIIPAKHVGICKAVVIKMITTETYEKHAPDWVSSCTNEPGYLGWFVIKNNNRLDWTYYAHTILYEAVKARINRLQKDIAKTKNEKTVFSCSIAVFASAMVAAAARSTEVIEYKKKLIAENGKTLDALTQQRLATLNEKIEQATAELHRINEKRMNLIRERGQILDR